MIDSPYVFTESEGLVHIKLRGDSTGQCRACVRKDAYEIISHEKYLEGWTAALVKAAEVVKGEPK